MKRSWWGAFGIVLLAGCASTSVPATRPAETAEETAIARPVLDPSKVLRHIGFGSCLHQERPAPILETVLQEDFDLFLFLGDNVYGDVDRDRPEDLAPLRKAYVLQGRSEELQKLRAATPTLAIWDDHDYGLNDAGADFAGREGAEKLFEDFWEIPPEAASAGRAGIYDSVVLGPPGRRVQLLLLDTRFFRSPLRPTDEKNAPGKERYLPDPDPAKTLLGDAQWRWLAEQLREPAELRLVLSSIQVIADGHGWEAWRNLPAERRRLFDVLRASGAGGLVVLSGDRHRAGIYRHDNALPYPLYEITSSSFNLPFPEGEEEAGPHRLGPTYRHENYGAIAIDWAGGIVELEIRGVEGDTVLTETIPFEDISP